MGGCTENGEARSITATLQDQNEMHCYSPRPSILVSVFCSFVYYLIFCQWLFSPCPPSFLLSHSPFSSIPPSLFSLPPTSPSLHLPLSIVLICPVANCASVGFVGNGCYSCRMGRSVNSSSRALTSTCMGIILQKIHKALNKYRL